MYEILHLDTFDGMKLRFFFQKKETVLDSLPIVD